MRGETKAKVLIVEDERRMREILKDRCEIDGLVVFEASDGEEGFAIAEKERPDIILLDILMPKMDGVKMSQKIRGTEWGKEMPIVFLTNLDEPPKDIDTNDPYIDYFVKVHANLEEVVQKVHILLDK